MNRHKFANGPPPRTLLLCTLILLTFCLAVPAARAADQEVTLSTEFQQRIFHVRDGVFSTLELQDKFPPSQPLVMPRPQEYRTLRVSSAEFAIYPQDGPALTAFDFIYQRHAMTDLPGGGKRLEVVLEGRSAPLQITLIYQTEPGKPWMRKRIKIIPQRAEGRSFFVKRIDVERLGYAQGGVSGGGIGQPIFLPSRNHFFGLEYPEGHDDWTGVITLSHYPGVAVGDELVSKWAVWGVAPDGQVEREFLQSYVPSIAIHSPSQPYVSFNEAFNAGSSATEDISRQSIATLKSQLVDAGVKVDNYSVVQWEDYDSIWKPSRELFPHGFGEVSKAAQDAGMGFGLWLVLTGGILDTHWGAARGMQVVRQDEVEGPYCTADPQYRDALEAQLRSYLLQDRVDFLWCDYNQFNCPERGYPAGSPVSREAEVDGYIDILNSVHKIKPATRVEITTGMWLSPWWLPYADWVWLGGSDIDYLTASGVPTLEQKNREEPAPRTKRYAEITYRDYVVWDDLRKQHLMFPAWGLKTHGFYNWDKIGGAPDPQAGIEGNPDCCDEPIDQFSDHVVTTLLRGTSDWNLLLNLHLMTPAKWQYLMTGLKWGRENWDTLSNTTMILGNPSHFEVYGYTHFRNGRGLIAIRNPADKEQQASISLSERNGFWDMPSSALQARQLYPCERSISGSYGYGNSLIFSLQPFETRVIELGRPSAGHDKLSQSTCPETKE